MPQCIPCIYTKFLRSNIAKVRRDRRCHHFHCVGLGAVVALLANLPIMSATSLVIKPQYLADDGLECALGVELLSHSLFSCQPNNVRAPSPFFFPSTVQFLYVKPFFMNKGIEYENFKLTAQKKGLAGSHTPWQMKTGDCLYKNKTYL